MNNKAPLRYEFGLRLSTLKANHGNFLVFLLPMYVLRLRQGGVTKTQNSNKGRHWKIEIALWDIGVIGKADKTSLGNKFLRKMKW